MAERAMHRPAAMIEQPAQGQERRRAPSGWHALLDWRLLILLPVSLFVALALIGPILAPDATAQNLAIRLAPPAFLGGTWDHPFGTDSLGRDVLARMLVGARLSLAIGVIAALVSAAIGISLGLLAAAGGWMDTLTTSLVELTLSVPTIVVGIVLVATLGQSLTNLIVVLVLSGWIAYARVVRLQARSLMGAEFVLASHALGGGRLHVALRHILLNLLPVIVILVCQQVAAVMLWEASLTYLGIGLPIERISLGGMVREGQERVFDGWWISLFPGLAIALAVIGFNLLADWLQGQLDPARRSWRRGLART